MGLDNGTNAENDQRTNGTADNNGSSIPITSLTSVEGESKKLPYPKSVFFIISNEFCERFNYYGMKTILVLYLKKKLLFDEDAATIIYHAFSMLVYFICIFGAIISDSWLGKFKTIFYLSIVYALGSVVISVGAIPTIPFSATISMFLGLLLIALGSGGIKPCVAAFGGDQFKLPAQAAQMATYFSLFYFSINAGSLISTALTPILRENVHCFGEDSCYSLAFGVPGALMIVSIVVFLLGKSLYNIVPPSGNMIVLVTKCITNAIVTKGREKKTHPRSHWLDYAESKYGHTLVEDTKILLHILVLYLPLPFFWALFDQQGSRWTFQATRMDGNIGFYEFKPDQLQVINPFLILVFIPLYEKFFYPLLSKAGIRRPLQKLTCGGFLAGIAFVLSALVEFQLEKTYPVLPGSNEAQLRFFNGLPCEYSGTTNLPDFEAFTLKQLQALEDKHVKLNDPSVNSTFSYDLTTTEINSLCPTKIHDEFILIGGVARSLFITGKRLSTNDSFAESPGKSESGDPIIRFLINLPEKRTLVMRNPDKRNVLDDHTNNRELNEVAANTYDILIDGKQVTTINLRLGSVITMIIRQKSSSNDYEHSIVEIAPPNSMNMMWLIPQYVILTLGEVMFSVTGLEFSYAQAPDSMKSVLQACWLLTVAFGNVLVIIISGSKLFRSQAFEFLLFAGLMFVDMLVFMLLAYRYKSVQRKVPTVQIEPSEDSGADGGILTTTEVIPSSPLFSSIKRLSEVDPMAMRRKSFTVVAPSDHVPPVIAAVPLPLNSAENQGFEKD